MPDVTPATESGPPPLTEDQQLAEWDWLVTANGDRLHHATLSAERASDLTDYGYVSNLILSCGRWVEMVHIPGILTRMGAMRCQRCCARTGFPQGKGSPKNDDACRLLVEARIESVA